jgi:hypothetical protein
MISNKGTVFQMESMFDCRMDLPHSTHIAVFAIGMQSTSSMAVHKNQMPIETLNIADSREMTNLLRMVMNSEIAKTPAARSIRERHLRKVLL